jgi:alpha-mannosidase
MRKVHLICNAHLDPVWQWDLLEGLGAAISTFRVAADFCEEFDNFVFNHNEAILYKWIEEYDYPLFERIKALVKMGKWHIMGGWYLQPDCNMPSGESIVRQISTGIRYFWEKFDVRPTIAVSMDCFGHSKGLVQILQKAGYTGYMFMRPDAGAGFLEDLPQTFNWQGYSGSEIKGFRLNSSYNTLYGGAAKAVADYASSNKSTEDILRCWGIGDHGGGPSRKDIIEINELIASDKDNEIIHSTPESFMNEMDINKLPKFNRDLNPIDVGCYTTMNMVKKLHRMLENKLAISEKVSSICDINSLVAYPSDKIDEAYTDLLFCEFHDILPGSSVKPVEEHAIQKLYHGLEITDNIINRVLYALSATQLPASKDEIPILILNPHPYEITDTFECEYMLSDQNWSGSFISGTVYSGDTPLPSQIEKENSSLNLDWRKKISFYGTVKPMTVNRFNCKLKILDQKPEVVKDLTGQNNFTFKNETTEIVLNTKDGSIDSYQVNSVEYCNKGLGQLLVYKDNFDPWLLSGKTIDELIGSFELLNESESAAFGGALGDKLSPIRVIEDGEVRTCIEVLLGYNNSRARVVYKLSKNQCSFDMEITIRWSEKDRLVRLNIPNNFKNPEYLGQDMFGEKVLNAESEMVAQKWVMAVDGNTDRAMSIINDCTYGLKIDHCGIQQSLLRAPAYTCLQLEWHPVNLESIPTLTHDRCYPRIDQGERVFNFSIMVGDSKFIKRTIDLKAQYKNELPVAVSYFPSGEGDKDHSVFTVEGVRMDTFKKSYDGKAYILRLYNYNDYKVNAHIVIDILSINHFCDFMPFEIKTMRVHKGAIREVNLIDEV